MDHEVDVSKLQSVQKDKEGGGEQLEGVAALLHAMYGQVTTRTAAASQNEHFSFAMQYSIVLTQSPVSIGSDLQFVALAESDPVQANDAKA